MYVLDETLVDAHLVAVPGLGTLTTGGLAGGDLEGLGGETDGALDAEVLALGTLDELGADLLEGLDLAGGEGDADLVSLLYGRRTPVSKLERVSSDVGLAGRGARWEVEEEDVREPQSRPSRPSGKTS